MNQKNDKWYLKLLSLSLCIGILLPSPRLDAFEHPPIPLTNPLLIPKSYVTNYDKTSSTPITVLVELHSDPLKVHNLKARNGLVARSQMQTYKQQINSEQADFKQSLLQSSQAQINHQYVQVFNGVSIQLPQHEVDQLLQLPHVKAIYPNQVFHEAPLTYADAEASLQHTTSNTTISLDIIGVSALWNLGFKGKGIRVGVIDSGVDYRHPSLAKAYRGGYDFVDNDNDPMETQPKPDLTAEENAKYATVHGTFVAGVLVGRGNPSTPTDPYGSVRGVAPEAELYAYRVLGPYKKGTTEHIVAAIEQAVQDDMDIINLSLSGESNSQYTADTVALNNAAMSGIIAVTSNGNRGPSEYSVTHPTGAHQAIAVGASTSTNINQQQIAPFSSRGPSLPDYEIKPDLVAPGTKIRSTVPSWDGDYSNAYKETNGTSMAAPHVAGTAALLLNKAEMEGSYFEPGEIKSILMNNAVPLTDAAGKTHKIHDQGAGRLSIPTILEAEAIALIQATTNVTNNAQPDDYYTGSLSFGQVMPGANIQRELILKDIVDKDQMYNISIQFDGPNHKITNIADQHYREASKQQTNQSAGTISVNGATYDTLVPLRAGEQADISIQLQVPSNGTEGSSFGHIILTEVTSGHTLRVPFSVFIGEEYTLPPIFSLKMTPNVWSTNQQTANIEYSVRESIQHLKLSVQHAVYGDMGTIQERAGITKRGHYEVRNWNGTVIKNNNKVHLPDGEYTIIPTIGTSQTPITPTAISFTINRGMIAITPKSTA
ncbi:S8 family serine peptidase [Paenibacillus arenosi]|uniref:S8 family serine peptidase n=1 Tax=Paenibacillus arenosi TaxID=2774142 RepID=A0ABR9AWG5_9BACL|nr:S8 family serine peptidase [Paenibacillus arenosi]MBD8497540.1 S8 family serine peptidase [Paenibacillus arenosi]